MSTEAALVALIAAAFVYAYWAKDSRFALLGLFGVALAFFRRDTKQEPAAPSVAQAPDTVATDETIQDLGAILDSVDDDRPGGDIGRALDLLDDADKRRRGDADR